MRRTAISNSLVVALYAPSPLSMVALNLLVIITALLVTGSVRSG